MWAFIGMLFLVAITGSVADASAAQPGLPLFFMQDGARYIAQAGGLQAVFSPDSVAFQAHGVQMRVRFAHAQASVVVEPRDPLGAHANILLGQDPSGWRTGLPLFGALRYRELYPGIDLDYAGTDGKLKAEFRVQPGADPRAIQLVYSGNVKIDEHGDLLVSTESGELREQAPFLYQETPHGRVAVAGRYSIAPVSASAPVSVVGDAHSVGFEVGPYDASQPLIIDHVISYSTYLGGSGMGAVTGLAVDSGGYLYATGWTEALDFPIAGAVQSANQGGVDAFVVKFNPSGTALVYATYIGGRGDDRGAAIAVDSSGQAYVTGSTASTNFPLASPIRATLGGTKMAFALKLNAAGFLLLYSTYLGGTNYEVGTAIAVDSSGNAYIAGDTLSANFPVLNGAQNSWAGGSDVFVSKLTAAGALVFSTYGGGTANDHAGGIAVDLSGCVYVAGGTYSTNFPVVAALQSVAGGNQDAFVTKFDASGAAVFYSTYLGGNGAVTGEQANAIAVDASGNAYVAGVTNSSNFPVTAGTFQGNYNGVSDAFVAKVSAAGSALVYSTFLGGSSFDWASGIRVDSSGNAYVAGYTSSLDFPLASGVQNTFGGAYDAFVSKLGPSGNALGFSTFYGGSGADTANAIALDSSGNMFVGGQTSSLNFPLASALQTVNNGSSVSWVARLGVTASPAQTPSTVAVSPSSGSGSTVTFSAQYTDTGGVSALTNVALLVNATASTGFACLVNYDRVNNRITLANDDPATGSLTVTPGGGSQQNSQCAVNGVGTAASVAGSTLTLTISITFQPATFAGAKTVYLDAADAGADTGWVARGAWTLLLPPPQPFVDSVSPNANSGITQTFTFVYSHSQSAYYLTGMGMLFNTSTATSNACDIFIDRNTNTTALLWDSSAGSDVRPLGSSTVLQNSSCKVGAMSIVVSGLSQIVTVTVTFKSTFIGTKTIYMYASQASLNTGLVAKGSFTVLPSGGVPQAVSVVPGSGSGPGQRFTFTVADAGGATFLAGVSMLFNSTLDTNHACYIVYERVVNRISLSYDLAANGSTPLTPGGTGVATNSQCTLRAATTTAVTGTTTIVVTVDLVFNAAWTGAKNVYLTAHEIGVTSGWVSIGTWTVTGGAPTADSMSPSSGTGATPSFFFTVSDSSSAANITGIAMLLTSGAPSNIVNACYMVYNRNIGTIGLYDDSATVLNTKPIGSSAVLDNSYCWARYTLMTTSGNSVVFQVNMQFKAAFSGTKSVYLKAIEPATDSGWVQRGTWTIP